MVAAIILMNKHDIPRLQILTVNHRVRAQFLSVSGLPILFAKNVTYLDPTLKIFHSRTASLIDSAVTCLFDLVYGQKAK